MQRKNHSLLTIYYFLLTILVAFFCSQLSIKPGQFATKFSQTVYQAFSAIESPAVAIPQCNLANSKAKTPKVIKKDRNYLDLSIHSVYYVI